MRTDDFLRHRLRLVFSPVLALVAMLWLSCETATNPVTLDGREPPGGDEPTGWSMVNPTWGAEHLLGVHVLDGVTATAVGESGTIIRSVDGGKSWVLQKSGIDDNLRGVHFVDEDTGWVVGDGGTILRTTDGGEIWMAQSANSGISFYDVDFGDRQSGTIVGTGGMILGSSDGGATWTEQRSGTARLLSGVDRIDAMTGVVVGGGALWTDDAGAHWNPATVEEGGLSSVAFSDANHGIAVGWGHYPPPPPKPPVAETNDGGKTWVSVRSYSTDLAYGLYDVAFSDQGYGFIVGSEGTVFSAETRSHTDGVDTEPLAISYAGGLWLIVGPTGAVFSRGHTGSFERQGTLSASRLSSVCFADTAHGNIVGEDGTILRTTDGGRSWVAQDIGTTSHLFDVCFVNSMTGFIAAGTVGVLRTRDGGVTWEARALDPAGIRAVAFWDEQLGLAFGSHGEVLRTLDGGDSWEMRASYPGCWYTGASFADAATAVAVCWGDKMIRTADGGASWSEVGIRYSYTNDVTFMNSLTGIAVGRDSDTRDVDPIMRTTDGGLTWTGIESGVSENFYGVHFVDAMCGFVGGSRGVVLHTNDGGLTWEAQQSPANTPLNAFYFLDRSTGIAVGDEGVILRTLTGGEAP